MRTLNFKAWIIGMMFLTAEPMVNGGTVSEPMAAIYVNRAGGYTAFMDKDRNVYTFPGHTEFTDGDAADVVVVDGVVIEATAFGALWRYDNKGTFTRVAYPWWYTGARPDPVHTEIGG